MDDRQAAANSMMKSAASLKMDDDIIEIEKEANTSTNASRRPSCLTPDRQALADSMMKSVTASVSKLRRGDQPIIYIVPQRIRQVNEVAYEPKIVSIGPYHNGKENLQAMEEHKWLYLHSFLSRNPNHRLEDYLKAMEELEDKARSCYSHNIGPQVGNEFVKMMVLDACFIVELFLKCNQYLNEMVEEQLAQKEEELRPKEKELEQKEEEELKLEEEVLRENQIVEFFQLKDLEDPILTMTGMATLVWYDMILLENQIPFFVLQYIFRKACPLNLPHKLAEMALDFFDQFMPRNKEIQIKDSYHHLLHLFHSHLITDPTHSKEGIFNVESVPNKKLNLSCNHTVESVLNKFKNISRFFPSSNKPQLPFSNNLSPIRIMIIPCATDLQLAGVRLKKNEKSNNILKVKFSHGVLEITPFAIHYHSDTLFRNLVAFEQCCLEVKFHVFTTYLKFMDFLVNTSKDVELLHRNGIIYNFLGSDDEVAHLFNRLCTGTVHSFEQSYLSDLKDNVQKHCEKKWNIWWASLKRDYFTNPWSLISLIAASILLHLTITQTFFTVFAYYRPPS